MFKQILQRPIPIPTLLVAIGSQSVCSPLDLQEAVFGVLPGREQTVARAEPYALIRPAQPSSGNALVYCDNIIVTDGFLQSWHLFPNRAGANQDLWNIIGRTLPCRRGKFNVRKVKSHVKPIEIAQRSAAQFGIWFGNRLADEFAGRAAEAADVPNDIAHHFF